MHQSIFKQKIFSQGKNQNTGKPISFVLFKLGLPYFTPYRKGTPLLLQLSNSWCQIKNCALNQQA